VRELEIIDCSEFDVIRAIQTHIHWHMHTRTSQSVQYHHIHGLDRL